MNLEQRLRRALAPPTGWPDERGAYDRFLRHRHRRLLGAAATAGLCLVLAGTLVVLAPRLLRDERGTAGRPAGPAPAEPGSILRASQGYELTIPPGWRLDEQLMQQYRQAGQDWLVLRSGPATARTPATITVSTAVLDPQQYPGIRRPKQNAAFVLPSGQPYARLIGRVTTGRRRDGRAFATGDQGGLVTHMIAWPYHCQTGAPCPGAAPYRVLMIEASADRATLPTVRATARRLVDDVRPVANALSGGPPVPERPGLFAEPLTKVAAGGSGDYAWELYAARRAGSGPHEVVWVEIRFPEGGINGGQIDPGLITGATMTAEVDCLPQRAKHKTVGVVDGHVPRGVATVRVVLQGRPPAEVPVLGREQPFGFTFFVFAPLPLGTRVLDVLGLDAAGRQVASGGRRPQRRPWRGLPRLTADGPLRVGFVKQAGGPSSRLAWRRSLQDQVSRRLGLRDGDRIGCARDLQ
jgi:hypothetical protein